jgi:putative ABC transport system permease protein
MPDGFVLRFAAALRRLAALLRRNRLERDLDDELAFHLAMRRGDGAPQSDTPLRFGNTLQVKEHTRDVWAFRWIETGLLDVRFAARLFVRERWLTTVAASALALCLGASTTAFAVLRVQTRGLPGDTSGRIVRVGGLDKSGRPLRLSHREFEALSAATTFNGVAAYSGAEIRLSEEGRTPEPVSGSYVTAAAFSLLGEMPILGRAFLDSDDQPGAPRTILLGYQVWQKRFNADPSTVGRTVLVNDAPATIIGVMRQGFRFPMVADAWLPLGQRADARGSATPRTIDVFGRLAVDRTLSEASVQLATLSQRLADQFPETNRETRLTVDPFVETNLLTSFWIALITATALLWLLGCINVANLLVARAISRAHETAIRLAQGATRWRVARLWAFESLLLTGVAATGAAVFTQIAFRMVANNLAGINFPYWLEWTLDAQGFLFLSVAALAAAVFVSAGPLLHLWSMDFNEALTERGRSGIGGMRFRRLMTGLIAAELTLMVVLVVAAGLMTRSFVALYRADSTIDSSNVLLTRVTLPPSRYPTREQQTAFFDRLREQVSAIPTVSVVSTATAVPFIGSPTVSLATETQPDASAEATVSLVAIGADYWETLRSSALRGRALTALDGTPGHESVMVNERLASLYFGTDSALGQRIRLTAPNAQNQGQWLEIVGIAPNVRHQQTFGLRDVDPVAYVPHRGGNAAWLMIRSEPESRDRLASHVREVLGAVDPALPLARYMVSLDDYMTQSRWPNRIFAVLFAAFAVISTILATVGLYAVTAYAVTRRTREIGIRMALGAQAAQVRWLFLRQAVQPLSVAAVVGLVAALAVGRLLTVFLMKTEPHDPLILVGTLALLMAVVAVACFWPTQRAARLDPASVLRHE